MPFDYHASIHFCFVSYEQLSLTCISKSERKMIGIKMLTSASFFSFPTDVKFILNPPSMIAAGSVVAAVQGLHLGNTNTFLSYQCLTHFLSKVIKCDPVSDAYLSNTWLC